MAELVATCLGEHLIFKTPKMVAECPEIIDDLVDAVPHLAKLLRIDPKRLPALDVPSAHLLASLSLRHPCKEGLETSTLLIDQILSTQLIGTETRLLTIALICLKAYPRELMAKVMGVVAKLSVAIPEDDVKKAIDDISKIQEDLGRALYHRHVTSYTVGDMGTPLQGTLAVPEV